MQELVIMDYFAFSDDFPYTVKWLFPRELNREKIFQDNLSHTLSDLKELVREIDMLNGNQRILETLKFDSQKEKQKKYIEENKRKIDEIDKRMNEEIAPYRWRIAKNIDTWLEGQYIKADYLLALVTVSKTGVECLKYYE